MCMCESTLCVSVKEEGTVNVAGEDCFTFQVFVRGECVEERDVCVCVSVKGEGKWMHRYRLGRTSPPLVPHTHTSLHHSPSLTVSPNVTVWPEQQEVNIHDMGRRVTFVCQAFGIPTPQVSHLCLIHHQM